MQGIPFWEIGACMHQMGAVMEQTGPNSILVTGSGVGMGGWEWWLTCTESSMGMWGVPLLLHDPATGDLRLPLPEAGNPPVSCNTKQRLGRINICAAGGGR